MHHDCIIYIQINTNRLSVGWKSVVFSVNIVAPAAGEEEKNFEEEAVGFVFINCKLNGFSPAGPELQPVLIYYLPGKQSLRAVQQMSGRFPPPRAGISIRGKRPRPIREVLSVNRISTALLIMSTGVSLRVSWSREQRSGGGPATRGAGRMRVVG